MKQNLVFAALILAAVAATGCASKGAKELPPPSSYGSSTDAGISTSGTGANGLGSGSDINAQSTAGKGYDLSTKIVYFAYDSADIDTAGQGVIANYGKYLSGTTSAKIRLEGHTDARGSAEYNVALGERRAQSVARELKAAGATDSQLSVISYGKERPAVPGSTEAAWAKNRRVEVTQP